MANNIEELRKNGKNARKILYNLDRNFHDKVIDFANDDKQAYDILRYFKGKINKKIPRQTLINAILNVKAKTFKNFFEEYNGVPPVRQTIENDLNRQFPDVDGR